MRFFTLVSSLVVSAAALMTCSMPTQGLCAEPIPMSEVEQIDPTMPPILSMRERARVQDALLTERLDTIVPALMREHKVDMWVLIAREYFEDPVVATMLDAENMHARRRTILVFYDPGAGKPVERLTVSRYGLGGLFAPAWKPEQPDQWKALAEIIAARDPKTIAINSSDRWALADGMTLSQYNAFSVALPQIYRDRIVPGDNLAVGWLETRTPAEMKLYPEIMRVAHSLMAEAFSGKVITPGVTTTDDVVWWYRERLAQLGLLTWFQPSVGIQRQGAAGILEGDTVIQPGDLLWTDFGITYMRLNTDTQHLAYVLKPGETEAPPGLRAGMAAANKIQDSLLSSYRLGASGNEVLADARAKAIALGLKPSIYSHPLGYHGHAAGTAIGAWDNQKGSSGGDYRIRANTAWSIELAAFAKVPEWNAQEVQFRLEENAFFDGKTVRYIDGRQTVLTVIPR
jgi:Xaa-Pro aminopeptidase